MAHSSRFQYEESLSLQEDAWSELTRSYGLHRCGGACVQSFDLNQYPLTRSQKMLCTKGQDLLNPNVSSEYICPDRRGSDWRIGRGFPSALHIVRKIWLSWISKSA